MAVDWDYTAAAESYDARPPYAAAVLTECLDALRIALGHHAIDVGAGTGRLTLALLDHGLRAAAVEPNAAMRARGAARTAGRSGVAWVAGVGETLPLAGARSDLVAFGSSFNVVDRPAALREAARVLKPGGGLLCLWNHRSLDDPLQARIESVIRERLPAYDYGVRRDDQASAIAASGLFTNVERVEHTQVHAVSAEAWLAAWRSHLTLRRQAGRRFDDVVAAIVRVVHAEPADRLAIPYITRAWIARRTPRAA